MPSAEARAIADGLGLPELDDLCSGGEGSGGEGSGLDAPTTALHADAAPFRPSGGGGVPAQHWRVPSWTEGTLATLGDGEVAFREGRPLFRRGSSASFALTSAAAAAAAEAEAEARMHALSCR